jgi:dTDP-4-dehydrorhamnose reductase
MKKTVVLLTGAAGQLGRELTRQAAGFPTLNLLTADRNQLDIGDAPAVNTFFRRNQIDFCLNCAAYTAVDKAESEPEAARRANIDGPANLARACAIARAPLVHLSSDYVYHNALNRPLLESDPTTPRGVYARTKLEGELAALSVNPRTMIVRTSWVYAAWGANFVTNVRRLGRERPTLRMVCDQIGTPTYTADLAKALLAIIQQIQAGNIAENKWHGIFNFSNEGVCSWYDFALTILRLSAIDCQVVPIESVEYPTLAQRPLYSVLNKKKIKTVFGLTIRHWQVALEECIVMMEQ